jgi:hypothetical protein
MCGWLSDGELMGDDARRWRRGGEIWGKRELTGGPHLSVMVER